MNLIALITECKSILFIFIRLNNLIRLYEATMANIRFCTLFNPIIGIWS